MVENGVFLALIISAFVGAIVAAERLKGPIQFYSLLVLIAVAAALALAVAPRLHS